MKKILILVRKIDEENLKLKKLISKFAGADIEIEMKPFSELIFEIEEGAIAVKISGEDIREYDLVYIRTISRTLAFVAGSLAYALEYLGVPYVNKRFTNVRAVNDKLTPLLILAVNKFPIIPAVFCSRENISKNADYLVKKFGFPIVVKEVKKHHSQGIFVLRNKSDFSKLISESKQEDQFLFQKFVPIESEYRLLVLGGSVKSVQKMYRDLDNFRAIIDYNRKEEFIGINGVSSQMKEMAIKSAALLNMQIVGVDTLIRSDNSKIQLLELNSCPGLTYDTKISPEIPEISKYLAKFASRE